MAVIGYIYKGIAFPFRRSASSVPATNQDDALIKQAIQQLILTAGGERVMRPEFGSGAYNFVFETNDDILVARIQDAVSTAIAKFEPRVIVQNITVTREATDKAQPHSLDSVVITVYYVVVATQRPDQAAVQVGTGAGVT